MLRAILVDGATSDGGVARERSVRWFFCDESHTNDPTGCARSQTAHALIGDGETVVARIAPSSSTVVQRTVLVAACVGSAATYDSALTILNCPDERGRAWSETEGVLAFYTLSIVPDGEAINGAPEIEQLAINGDASATVSVERCAAEPCASASWVLTPTAGSAESLGDTRETLTASFFATEGSFDRPRAITLEGSDGRDGALSAKWTPPRTAQRVRAWVVLRDSRGASAVIERAIDVR